MVSSMRARVPMFRPPVATSKALFYGNSISDSFIVLGQWADALCARYGWQRLASNMIPNGRFDTDIQGWRVISANINALTRIAATAMTGTTLTAPPAAVGGTQVAKFIPFSPDTLIYASPYAPAAISQGFDTAGDATAAQFNCNMQPPYTYCFSCYVCVPAATAANSIYLSINDNVGQIAASAFATNATPNAWQRLSVIGTVVTGRTQSYLRILDLDPNVAHQFYATGFQLERVPNPSPYTGYPVAWTDHYRRGAISGSILESNDWAANASGSPRGIATDGVTRLTASITGLATPPDIVFVLYNTNDLYYTSGGGAVTPMTAVTWRNAMHAVIGALVSMPNSPKVVVVGCTDTLQPYPGGIGGFTIVGGSGYTNGAAVGAITNPAGYPAGGSFAGTLVVSAGAITGVTITTPGINYQVGATAAMSGGSGGSLTVNSLVNLGIPFGAASMDQAAQQMDAITQNECELAGAQFVPLRALMHGATHIQAGANGKHPNAAGQQAIADLVSYAIENGS